jgi:hypothetical protein
LYLRTPNTEKPQIRSSSNRISDEDTKESEETDYNKDERKSNDKQGEEKQEEQAGEIALTT